VNIVIEMANAEKLLYLNPISTPRKRFLRFFEDFEDFFSISQILRYWPKVILLLDENVYSW